jgi:hypothetical protein
LAERLFIARRLNLVTREQFCLVLDGLRLTSPTGFYYYVWLTRRDLEQGIVVPLSVRTA